MSAPYSLLGQVGTREWGLGGAWRRGPPGAASLWQAVTGPVWSPSQVRAIRLTGNPGQAGSRTSFMTSLLRHVSAFACVCVCAHACESALKREPR